jgi:hypothetical protein
MEKKGHFLKSFKNESEMDRYLESTDIGKIFEDHGKLHQPKIKKVNIDLPVWLIMELDFEASRAGISRQPLIKLWLMQKLDEERKKRSA